MFRLSPFDVLGVGRGADADEIRTAYRKLALKWHPGIVVFTFRVGACIHGIYMHCQTRTWTALTKRRLSSKKYRRHSPFSVIPNCAVRQHVIIIVEEFHVMGVWGAAAGLDDDGMEATGPPKKNSDFLGLVVLSSFFRCVHILLLHCDVCTVY